MTGSRAIAATITLAIAAVGCGRDRGPHSDEPAPPPAAVRCVAAASGPVAETVILRGVVAPPPGADAVLSPMVAGRVVALRVEVGDRVRAGQVIARVEDPALGAGAQEGAAAIASAQAALTEATTARARADKLVGGGIAARRELDEAIAREASARADLAAARARAGAARGQAARAELRAPIDGVVLRIFRRLGEAVDGTPATPVAEIADLVALELHADAAAGDLVRLTAGAPAILHFDALPDARGAGTIAALAPAVDPATSLGAVRIAIAAGDGAPRVVVGLSGSAAIALAPHAGLVIAPGALRRGLTGADEVVVCAGAPLVAAVRPVEVGARLTDGVEITGGLAAGERVVVDRALGLADGQALIEAP